MSEFNKHSRVHSATIHARFHGWGKALAAAGVGHRFWTKCTDGAMLEELRRVGGLLNQATLSKDQFDKHAKITSNAIEIRFHGWGKALDAAGLGHLLGPRPATSRMRDPAVSNMSNDDVLAELRRVAQKVGTDTLTQEQLRAHSLVSSKDVRRRFGSWPNDLREAGLRHSKYGKRYSKEQYFENLLTVWTHCGRQPRLPQMDKPPSAISGAAYVKSFGKWTNALVALVERMNESADPKDGAIPAGLRLEILKRDGFRCTLCGRTPRSDRRCELHVDHIVPSSKRGPISPDNLRTTCSVCNLGKGDTLD